MDTDIPAQVYYTLVRIYFSQMAELERVAIAPYFGQMANVDISGTIYFENLNGRILRISVIDVDDEENYYVDDFSISGIVQPMLTVKTRCLVESLPSLWRVRSDWIKDGEIQSLIVS